MNLSQSGPSPPQLLIAFHPLLGIHKKPSWNGSQSRLASFTGTDHHASVKLPLRTFTPWLSTFALQLINGAFDHRPIGEEGFYKRSHFVQELNQGVAKAAEFFSGGFILYSHNVNSIQI
jgi:hypothetical protein